MRYKTKTLSNFSHAITTTAHIVRPDNEAQLQAIFSSYPKHTFLARGHGLSYSDSCVNHQNIVIDTSRLNHILAFDVKTGVAICQGGVTFADLFLIDPHFIPPIIPGTLQATLAGGVAHDVHGKNNPHEGSLGCHIEWLELQIGETSLRCSPTEHAELFHASLAGLGLTGFIKRIAIRLKRASRHLNTVTEKFSHIPALLTYMQAEGLHYDYQVAWLDLMNSPKALLSLANHSPLAKHPLLDTPINPRWSIPKLPVRVIHSPCMKLFNQAYYHHINNHPKTQTLWHYNNPLDSLSHWNRLYGKKGVLQFQAVFAATSAARTIQTLLSIIKTQRASPTLAVLKYFTQKGRGLLSFTEPGFTLAIDFIHEPGARRAISLMNEVMNTQSGKVYLAKDLLLTPLQFKTMYPRHDAFATLLQHYQSPMESDLSKRLQLREERL